MIDWHTPREFIGIGEITCKHCNGTGGGYWCYPDPPEPCDNCLGHGYEHEDFFIIERKKGMNYTSAVMLINEGIRAIRCSYEPAAREGQEPVSYIFKTLDKSIKVGDFVAVPTDTRWKQTINRVEAVDVEVEFDSDIQLKWIIGKVEQDSYKHILAEEQKWIETLKAAEKRKKREELKKSVIDLYGDEATKLQLTAAPQTIEQ